MQTMEEFHRIRRLPELLAVVGVEADDETVLRRRGEDEDVAPDDDGRGVPAAGQFRLEDDVGLVPVQRDVRVVDDAGAVRPAEAGPVLGGDEQGSEEEGGAGERGAESEHGSLL